MSILINGFKISYDYEEFLNEFREEIEDGILSLESEVAILRHSDERFNGAYAPIIDWWYLEDVEKDNFEIISVKNLLDEMEKVNSVL